MKIVLAGVLISCSVACSMGLRTGPDSFTYYVLRAEQGEVAKRQTSSFSLLVSQMEAPSFLDSRKIVTAGPSQTRGAYQYSLWTESASKSLTTIFLESIKQAKLFRTVSRLGSGAVSDLQLNTELIEFHHDTTSRPGEVVVEISTEIVNLKTREIIGARRLSARVPVRDYNAAGATKGFRKAIGALSFELMEWLEEVVTVEL